MIGISRLHFPVTGLGPGSRCGIWVQGCSIGCTGCVSRDTWNPASSQQLVEVAAVADWVQSFESDGVTITGGEPFDQPDALLALITELRHRKATRSLSVLAYSGYSMDRLRANHASVLEVLDAVIAGPFVRGSETEHPWYGSGNQELSVINVARAHEFEPGDDPMPTLQVQAAGGQLWITGIPRRGDLERMEAALAERGVLLGEVSWRA